MKNLNIFEPQIEKHYAYKKKNMYCTLIDTTMQTPTQPHKSVEYDDFLHLLKDCKVGFGYDLRGTCLVSMV